MDRLIENLVEDLEPQKSFSGLAYGFLAFFLAVLSWGAGLYLAFRQGVLYFDRLVMIFAFTLALTHVFSILMTISLAQPAHWLQERIPAWSLVVLLFLQVSLWWALNYDVPAAGGQLGLQSLIALLGLPTTILFSYIGAKGSVTNRRALLIIGAVGGASLSTMIGLFVFGGSAVVTFAVAIIVQLLFTYVNLEFLSSKTKQRLLIMGKKIFNKGIPIGESLPEFIAKNHQGKEVRLSDFEGKKVWVMFYRYAKCPLCRYHLWKLKKKMKALKASGLEVVAVYENDASKFSDSDPIFKDLDIPLLADPEKRLYRRFGVGTDWSKVFLPQASLVFAKALFSGILQGPINGHLATVPQHYLIDETGVVRDHYIGKTIADHIPDSRVEAFVN